MINDPQQFDWVDARAACSIKAMFIRLHQGVQMDAEKATTLQPLPPAGYPKKSFETTPLNGTGMIFSVFSNENKAPVQFTLKDDQIEIQTANGPLSVTVALDNQGKCKLRVNRREELEEWQVRKLVLEDLFFGTASAPSALS
jgi:hypothetical protein